MKEKVSVNGSIEINVYKHGKLIETIRKQNLVVTNGLQMLANLLGGTILNNVPQMIGFGTGTAAPILSDNTLTGITTKTLGTPTYPNPNQIAFPFSVLTTDANMNVTEMGLLTANSTLFNRIVLTNPIIKDSSISFTGTWTITF